MFIVCFPCKLLAFCLWQQLDSTKPNIIGGKGKYFHMHPSALTAWWAPVCAFAIWAPNVTPEWKFPTKNHTLKRKLPGSFLFLNLSHCYSSCNELFNIIMTVHETKTQAFHPHCTIPIYSAMFIVHRFAQEGTKILICLELICMISNTCPGKMSSAEVMNNTDTQLSGGWRKKQLKPLWQWYS